MKRIIAGAIVAIPLMTAFATKASASEVIINHSLHSFTPKSELIARARHRVWIPARTEYRNHHRIMIPGHWEWRN